MEGLNSPQIEVYDIRHAQTFANLQPEFAFGHIPEVDITELGQAQAIRLGNNLRDQEIVPDFVYTSDTVRTRDTRLLSIGGDATVDRSLRELHQGDWEGRLWSEVLTPAVLEQRDAQGRDFAPNNGESMNDVGARKLAAIDQMADRHAVDGQTITIFTYSHGLANLSVAAYINDWSYEDTRQKKIENTAVSKYTRTPAGLWEVNYVGLDSAEDLRA